MSTRSQSELPIVARRSVALALLATLVLALDVAAASAQTSTQRSLTLDGARRVLAAAGAYATSHDAPGGAIAVVDAGGQLVALERLDGTFPAAPAIALGKARTAALFRRPTSVFEKLVNDGRTTMVTLPDFTPLQGGVPIVVDGEVVGAVGVSGAASAQQDEEIALAAAAADLGPAASGDAVSFLDRARVEAAFAAGQPLVEVSGYKVHASRRDAPGEAEVHAADTDIFYVLSGEATFVTGGRLVDARAEAPNELRAPSIAGGDTRTLKEGDVIVVPRGTPHWFSRVSGPFLYYVVKVAA